MFGPRTRFTLDGNEFKELNCAVTETAVRELALNIAINMIAKTVAKCEVKQFKSDQEYKGLEYYLWNVKPNVNENAFDFFKKLIYRLCMQGEALIIFENPMHEDRVQAFVADYFYLKTDRTLYSKVYSGVIVGELEYNKDFYSEEVLYFKYENEDIKRLIDLFYNSYRQLLDMSIKSFKRSRGERGVLTTGAQAGNTEYTEKVTELINNHMSKFINSINGVLPLAEGQKYERVNGTGQRELTEATDIRKLINDVFDVTAMAFGIPPALMRGEMADSSQLMNNYLTFCIDPICDMISTEINAKRFSKDDFRDGNYIEINTSRIKHIDRFSIAAAVDKLISSGTMTINEIRKELRLPKSNSKIADTHIITKNYTLIEDIVNEILNE